MPSPLTVAGFPDNLDPRFREITDGEYEIEKDMIPEIFGMETPTQLTERGSSLTPMELMAEFTGTITYGGPVQGYNWTTTAKEYALGTVVERKLVEYDQFNIIETRFKLLARSARQARQVFGASVFTNAFIVDPNYTNSEAVALCSDSHTTPFPGVSTAIGFSNTKTSAFSPAALKAAYIQGMKFRDNAGQPIDGMTFDKILGPVDLTDRASEVFLTGAGLDSAAGTVNVLKGRYDFVPWIRLANTKNWFLLNNAMQKENLLWFDKVKPEFARVEDFDSFNAKYRAYAIWHYGRADWRWCLGSNVS
jgi:hypothetical protein